MLISYINIFPGLVFYSILPALSEHYLYQSSSRLFLVNYIYPAV